jgi:predicted Zn-dependent peptidase
MLDLFHWNAAPHAGVMRAMQRLLVAAALLLTSLGAQAADLRAIVKEHQLSNGMKWLIVERPQAPVFTGYVRVKVGGMDEEPGFTGLAHLFEHMAFKGTPVLGTSDFEKEKGLLQQIAEVGDNLAKLKRAGQDGTDEAKALAKKLEALGAEHDKLTDENALATLYQLNGAANLNATTNKDLTSYFVSLPKNRLEMWALVEASRLSSPVLRDFYKERDVVLEERRMRTDSEPGGAVYEELNQLAFTMSPYRWPVVGYTEDLLSMTMEKAVLFRERFYVPSNAVGCIVGDVKFDEAVKILERTFGAIPAGAIPPRPIFSEPPNRNARRSSVIFDASPRLYVGFRKPSLPARDDYVFDVIEVLLGQGRTARLHKRLVLKDRLVQGIGTFGGPGSRLENLFVVAAIPLAGVKLESVEKALWDELDRLKTEKVSAQELEKVRNRLLADQSRNIDSNDGLASSITFFEAVAGDWRYLADHSKQIASITPEDVQRVAQTYFTRTNSVSVDLQRPEKVAAGKEVAR